MKHNYLTSVWAIVALMSLNACQKDETAGATQVSSSSKTASNIMADVNNTGHYTFYSLRDNKEVPLSDSATTKWDIGLRTTTIIINGGNSGPGIGGAQVLVSTYSNLNEVPETGYNIDTPQGKAIPTGSGNGWYNYDQTANVISSIPGRVIAVKTADGKYAKLEILSYYKDAPANPTRDFPARYYTFRYVYQADGTRNVK